MKRFGFSYLLSSTFCSENPRSRVMSNALLHKLRRIDRTNLEVSIFETTSAKWAPYHVVFFVLHRTNCVLNLYNSISKFLHADTEIMRSEGQFQLVNVVHRSSLARTYTIYQTVRWSYPGGHTVRNEESIWSATLNSKMEANATVT